MSRSFSTLLPVALLLAGCGARLPEAESREARLYVQYCAAAGCHAPFSPRRAARGYWEIQLPRMLKLMRRQGRPLPAPEERQAIEVYLYHNALGAQRERGEDPP